MQIIVSEHCPCSQEAYCSLFVLFCFACLGATPNTAQALLSAECPGVTPLPIKFLLQGPLNAEN